MASLAILRWCFNLIASKAVFSTSIAFCFKSLALFGVASCSSASMSLSESLDSNKCSMLRAIGQCTCVEVDGGLNSISLC